MIVILSLIVIRKIPTITSKIVKNLKDTNFVDDELGLISKYVEFAWNINRVSKLQLRGLSGSTGVEMQLPELLGHVVNDTCPGGTAFLVELDTCNWPRSVINCTRIKIYI